MGNLVFTQVKPPPYPRNDSFFFTFLNPPVPSEINGSAGSFKDSCDVARPECSEVKAGCKGVRHAHKVRGVANDAARGYAERMASRGTPVPKKEPKFENCDKVYDDSKLSCPDPRHTHVLNIDLPDANEEAYIAAIERSFDEQKAAVSAAQIELLPPYEADEDDILLERRLRDQAFREVRDAQDVEFARVLAEAKEEAKHEREFKVEEIGESEESKSRSSSDSLPLSEGVQLDFEPYDIPVLDDENSLLFATLHLEEQWAFEAFSIPQINVLYARFRRLTTAVTRGVQRDLLLQEIMELLNSIVHPRFMTSAMHSVLTAFGFDAGEFSPSPSPRSSGVDPSESEFEGDEGDEGEEGDEGDDAEQFSEFPIFDGEFKLSELQREPAFLDLNVPADFEDDRLYGVRPGVPPRQPLQALREEDMDQVMLEDNRVANEEHEPLLQGLRVDILGGYMVEHRGDELDEKHGDPFEFPLVWPGAPDNPPPAPQPIPPKHQSLLSRIKKHIHNPLKSVDKVPSAPSPNNLVSPVTGNPFYPVVQGVSTPKVLTVNLFGQGGLVSKKRILLDALLSILPGFYKQTVAVSNSDAGATRSEAVYADPSYQFHWAFDLGKYFMEQHELQARSPVVRRELLPQAEYLLLNSSFTSVTQVPISEDLLSSMFGNTEAAGADLLCREALGVGSKEGTVEYRLALHSAATRFVLNHCRALYNEVYAYSPTVADNTVTHFCQIRVFHDLRKFFFSPKLILKLDFRPRGA